MNFAASLLPDNVVAALGWTLVHSLWQGALAALGFAVLLFFVRSASARARYAIGLAMLALVLVASAITFWNHYAVPAAAGPAALAASGGAPTVAAETGAAVQSPLLPVMDFFSGYFSRHLLLIVTLWLLGLLFLSLRFTGGMLYARRLKVSRCQPLSAPWPERLQALAGKAGLRRPIKLLESLRLRTPVVIGHLKPVLLLPAGLIIGLPAAEVEALLAHELAHVMRRDYLMNVLQNLLEIIYFFHPGVHWISSCVRQEREYCCDDIAVELCGDAPGYARALASLQASAALALPVVAASGGSLLRRISRLLAKPRRAHDFREGFLSALLLVAGLLAMVKLVAAPAAAPSAEPTAGPAAAVEPDADRFGRIGFVLDADGKVQLSVRLPAGLAGQAVTWIIDAGDGSVVWYMPLGARPINTETPFQEEVSLKRGTYSWYLPAGLAASASASGAARLNVAATERLHLAEERQLREHLLQSRLKEEQERAERERKAEEARKLREELDALEALEKEQKAEALQRARDEEQRLLAEEERQREERNKLAAEQQTLAEQENRLGEEEQEKIRQAMEELREREQELDSQETMLKEQEKQEVELRLQEQKKAEEEDLRAAELKLRAEKKRLRREQAGQKTQLRKFDEFFRDLIKKEGLANSEGRYELKLSASTLLINGKPQSAAVHQRAKEFIESVMGRKLTEAQPITFVHENK